MQIRRIVKMTFDPDRAHEFVEVFEGSKRAIRAFQGNYGLQLLRSTDAPNVFFTLSDWESEAALNAYRESELFLATWAKTKALFSARAEAWSVSVLDDLE